MSTRDQRETAFRDAGAILALEGMIEPEGHAQLRQEVIDGKLSFDEAVAKVKERSAREASRNDQEHGGAGARAARC